MQLLRLVLVILALLSSTCDRPEQPAVASPLVSIPAPPDTGEVSRYLSCKAEPRRQLTPRERCELEVLASKCTNSADCYVSCISSPDGPTVGGGCEHVCASAQPEPLPDTSGCDNLPGVSGFEQQRLGPNYSSKPMPLRGTA